MVSSRNNEGEEYLRQRSLEIPFSLTRGEAILYNTGPTVDVTVSQFNKKFSNTEISNDMEPRSLLDCFLRQDETAYTQTVEPPSPLDQVFKESHALVTIHSDVWQDNRALVTTGEPVAVKADAKQSVMAVIDNFEKMAQNGDFGAGLQDLEVDDAELMELENPLKRLGQEEDQPNNVSSELDSILTNEIFDYIDRVLFQEKGGNGLDARRPSSLCNNPQEPYSDAALFSATPLCQPQFNTQSPHHTYSPKNGLYTHQQDPGQRLSDSAQILNSTQKLSHQGPLIAAADTNLPPLQQLQLQDIFSPSIELPDLVVPDALASFQSRQVPISHMGGMQRIPAQTQFLPNNLPAMAGNGHMLQSSVQQPENIALPQLIPCNDLSSPIPQIIPIPFAAACLQGSSPFETHKVQQWPQGQQQMLPQSGSMQNGYQLMPAYQGQPSESQTVSHSGLWPRQVTGLNHTLQGGLACGQAATNSSCMFEQNFSSSPAVGDMLALSGSSDLRQTGVTLDPSPLQGSCCFQWSCSEPVVGASTINQENGNIPSEHIQHYQENHRQTQVNMRVYICGIFIH